MASNGIKTINLIDQVSNIDFVPGEKAILLCCFHPSGNEPYRNLVINFNGDTICRKPNFYKYSLTNKNIMFGPVFANLFL